MCTKKIRLYKFDDVKDFVLAAEKCDYDVDVSYNRVIIDAKSLMGVLSMDLTKVLTVKYSEEDTHFSNWLDQYAVS